MPIELKVLGYAALLQFVQFVVMAIPVSVQLGVAYTGGNRDAQKQATGVPGRLKRALENHFEGLILFSIAVFVLTFADKANTLSAMLAWVYLVARIFYVPAYYFGLTPWRSLIWMTGFGATVLMLLLALR